MSTHSHQQETVAASVYYAAANSRHLFCYAGTPPQGEPETNVEFVEHVVAVRDARRRPSALQLDSAGAAMLRHRSAVRSFYDEEELRRVGYPETAAIVRAVSGAEHVVVFDHNIRRGGGVSQPNPPGAQQPVFHVHTDFTADSAPVRARAVLDRELAPGARIAAINLWRPLAQPVRDSPLAVCDASSVAQAELVPADLLYPERKGEIYYVKFSPRHRWYYLPDMRTDEVWVFKNYDSATDGRARFTPHTAFLDPKNPAAAARESVEFRTFAVFGE